MAVQLQPHEPVAVCQDISPAVFKVMSPCTCRLNLTDSKGNVFSVFAFDAHRRCPVSRPGLVSCVTCQTYGEVSHQFFSVWRILVNIDSKIPFGNDKHAILRISIFFIDLSLILAVIDMIMLFRKRPHCRPSHAERFGILNTGRYKTILGCWILRVHIAYSNSQQ